MRSRTEDTGLVIQPAELNAGGLGHAFQGGAAHGVLHSLQPQIAKHDQVAGKDHLFNIQDAHHRPNRFSKGFASRLHHPARIRVAAAAALRHSGDIQRLAGLRAFLHLLQHGARAGQRFQAAIPAAAAHGAILLDDDMADFAGAAAITLEQLPVDEDARADTVFDRDHNQVIAAAGVAVDVLADGGGLAIVKDGHRQMIAFFQQASQGEIAPMNFSSEMYTPIR